MSNGDVWFNAGFAEITGKNWLDSVDFLVSNILLPLGGLGIALFVGWRMSRAIRAEAFATGSKLAGLYGVWLVLIQWLAPLAVLVVFLNAVGLIDLSIAVDADAQAHEAETAPRATVEAQE